MVGLLENTMIKNKWRRQSFLTYKTRIYAAEHAPICNERMRREFGYLANTVAADNVLDGAYSYSEGFHPATKELLEECARIRARVPENLVCNFLGGREWQRR